MNQQQRRVLTACTIGNAISMTPTVHAVFGTFLVPLSDTFGWPRAAVSGALTIMALVAAVAYPLAGRHADRQGARRLLLAGVTVLALGIAALALGSGSLPQYYLTFFLISLGGSAAATPIYAKVVADWFETGRGTALGIASGLGNGAGSVIFPIVAAIAIGAAGWRAGYLAIAGLMLVVGLPVLLALLRDAPRQAAVAQASDEPKDGLTVAEALRLPHFWVILLAIALGGGCTTAIFSHVVPILTDRGYGVELGTAVVSTFALATSAWQIACGRLLDKVASPRVVIPMLGMAIAGLLLLQFGSGAPLLIAAGVALGIGMGAQYGALPYFIARYFGMRAFGSIIGLMYSAVIIAQGITPVLLDHAYDTTGSYRIGVLAAAAVLAGAAALLLALPRYGVVRPAADDGLPVPAAA